MKRTLLLLLMITSFEGFSQIVAPQPSPSVSLNQTVGLSEVTLNYSRPAMRGRKVMGNLVPYNAIWRTGANANSTFAVNTPFEFGGTILEAGTYAVFTKPAPSQWEVFLYRKSDNWGAPAVWDPSLVAATATVSPQQTERTMTSFSMNINEITLNGAHLEIHWENTLLAVPFSVPTDQMVMNSIEKNPKPCTNCK